MDFDPPEQSNPDTQDRPSRLERVRVAVIRWCPVVATGLDLAAEVLSLSNADSLAHAARLSAMALRAFKGFSGRSRE
ncbi:hypothetical protein [Nocardia tengchongensis]|uniref:hypothetical protein n=1 Tax=Nocardia tengchongensis TaxID=2055889 RepID=UPI0036BC6A95